MGYQQASVARNDRVRGEDVYIGRGTSLEYRIAARLTPEKRGTRKPKPVTLPRFSWDAPQASQ